jgi:hypothetical protein
MCWITGNLSITSAKNILTIPVLTRCHVGQPLRVCMCICMCTLNMYVYVCVGGTWDSHWMHVCACVCVCVCVCVEYVYVCVCVCICDFREERASLYLYVCVCICMCFYVSVCVYMYLYVSMCACTYALYVWRTALYTGSAYGTHVPTHMYYTHLLRVHVRMGTCAHGYMCVHRQCLRHTCTHAHMCMHAYVHTSVDTYM